MKSLPKVQVQGKEYKKTRSMKTIIRINHKAQTKQDLYQIIKNLYYINQMQRFNNQMKKGVIKIQKAYKKVTIEQNRNLMNILISKTKIFQYKVFL